MWKKPAGNFVGWAVASQAPWSPITSTFKPGDLAVLGQIEQCMM